MTLITRTYVKVCPSCSGSGCIPATYPTTTAVTEICPACHGNKTIIVTETFEEKEETK